jgi:outer membrane protein assembly factor BamB
MNILTPTAVGDLVFTSAYGGKSLLLEVSNRENSWYVEEKWVNKVNGYMSSPVVIDGQIYLHLRNQRFTCIDLYTGETRWTTTPFGRYWSLVANGNKILALDERGELLLIRASPEKFDLLDSRKVSDEPTWAHIAVCGDEIFIRDLNGIAAYRWTATASQPESKRSTSE